MDDGLNLSMFRAYDIRTPAARLTPELSARLARAEARYFRDVVGVGGVLVAHDARRSGPGHLAIAADVFRDAGLEVLYLPGAVSASYLYHAAMRQSRHAAILFGASHNPASDIGQKLVAPGVRPIAEGIGPEGGLNRIKEFYINDEPFSVGRKGSVRVVEQLAEYVAYSLERAGVGPGQLRGTAILQDYLSGSAGREMMLAFDRAGAELTPLHFVPDGGFPHGDPNPVKQDVIRAALERLRRGAFLAGMIFDGDGDRIDIYNGNGTYIEPSFVYAAILPEIRRRFSGPGLGVFADLKANPLAVIEMARSGLTVDVIRNGHSQIKQALADDLTRFGAVEESAHFYEAFGLDEGSRFCTENTLYVALLVARVWREVPERFDRLAAIQSGTARAREWGYKFPSAQARAEALHAVREHFEQAGAFALERMRNGMDLEATLLRRGLPFDVGAETTLAPDWLQVCQRVSQSEDGLARWDAVAASSELVEEAKQAIGRLVARFGAGGEYQG